MMYPLEYTTSETRRIMEHWSYELQIEDIQGTDRWSIHRLGKTMIMFTRVAPNKWCCLTSEGIEQWREHIEKSKLKLDTTAHIYKYENARK